MRVSGSYELMTLTKNPFVEYSVHCYRRSRLLGGICITDEEYQRRIAYSLLNSVLDEFEEKYEDLILRGSSAENYSLSTLESNLQKYQNPNEADKITKLQIELDETKIIMHNTIDSVLERGQKLDDLIYKSEDLSESSKMFARTADNRCCTIQ